MRETNHKTYHYECITDYCNYTACRTRHSRIHCFQICKKDEIKRQEEKEKSRKEQEEQERLYKIKIQADIERRKNLKERAERGEILSGQDARDRLRQIDIDKAQKRK